MPVFFLFAQLAIAVVCLAVSHLFGIFVVPEYVASLAGPIEAEREDPELTRCLVLLHLACSFNLATVRALWKLIALNVSASRPASFSLLRLV
jgi:hypothetical protein